MGIAVITHVVISRGVVIITEVFKITRVENIIDVAAITGV